MQIFKKKPGAEDAGQRFYLIGVIDDIRCFAFPAAAPSLSAWVEGLFAKAGNWYLAMRHQPLRQGHTAGGMPTNRSCGAGAQASLGWLFGNYHVPPVSFAEIQVALTVHHQ